jgi:hypothetical protein
MERRNEAKEIEGWVLQRFPLEERSRAAVALAMLRFIHGKGNVTLAMVRARMQANDERHGLVDDDNQRSQ